MGAPGGAELLAAMRSAVLVLLLAAMAGCTEPVGIPNLAGEWTGAFGRAARWTFDFDASRNPNELAGTVLLSPGYDLRGVFSGTYDHPDVTLHLRLIAVGQPVELTADYYGTVNEEVDDMVGTIVLSEVVAYHLVLVRTR